MLEIKKNHSLKTFSSWRIGGEADYFCTPKTIEELIEAEKFALEKNIPIQCIGLGSNLLISDDGVEGLVICMRQFKGVEFTVNPANSRLEILCMSGTLKMELQRIFIQHQLPPAMMFAGIPGDVGGGIVMNAGISEEMHPREFYQVVDWIEVLREGKILRFQNQDITWNYRKSLGWQPGIITRAQISWDINDKTPDIAEKVKEANRIRVGKQPLDMPSCGSVFKNPKPHSSGRLIEEAGLKGFQIGGAQVSQKHANFIINTGDAKASDMDQVIRHIQKSIREKFQIDLHTEVVYIGRW